MFYVKTDRLLLEFLIMKVSEGDFFIFYFTINVTQRSLFASTTKFCRFVLFYDCTFDLLLPK